MVTDSGQLWLRKWLGTVRQPIRKPQLKLTNLHAVVEDKHILNLNLNLKSSVRSCIFHLTAFSWEILKIYILIWILNLQIKYYCHISQGTMSWWRSDCKDNSSLVANVICLLKPTWNKVYLILSYLILRMLMGKQNLLCITCISQLIEAEWHNMCISNLTIIGSDNGLSPVWRQAIIWTNAWILLIGP